MLKATNTKKRVGGYNWYIQLAQLENRIVVGERRLRGASFLVLPVTVVSTSLLLKNLTLTTFAPEILIHNRINELFLVFTQV